MNRLRYFFRDSEAATAVEYAVILTMIVVACLGALRLLGEAGAASLANSNAQIEQYFPAGS